MKSGKDVTIDGPVIPSKTAETIRRMKDVASIDAYF
jgi:hypothetical protein